MLLPSELQLGDIICFHTKTEVPEHVAMYTCTIHGKIYVTHSVLNTKAGYRSGLQTTILKNIGRIDVFRPKNTELGVRAAERLLKWAKYPIPYDERRKEWMLKTSEVILRTARREDKEEPIDYLVRFLEKAARVKFYERIKFAARRDTCPIKILDGIEPRGFTCVQAIILAYQVEELVDYVKTLDQVKIELAAVSATLEQINEAWISDKHCPAEIMDTYKLPDSYIKYNNALRDREELPDIYFTDKRDPNFTHPHYHPSLVAWDFDKEPSIDEFIKKFDSCLNLPAKFCFTDALFAYMSKNTKHWTYLGLLDVESLPTTFSTQEKEQYKLRRSDLELETLALRAQIIRERTLSSPTLSTGSTSPRLATVSPIYGMTSTRVGANSLANNDSTQLDNTAPRGYFRRLSSFTIKEASNEETQETQETLDDVGFRIISPLVDRKYAKKNLP